VDNEAGLIFNEKIIVEEIIMLPDSDVFQGERGGTPSPHLFYQGNGIPPAKIKRGGTPFPLAGIKYE
jgi:hypothetical protein